MTSKEELLSLLKKARVTEERAIPIYTKHLESAVFWAGLSEDAVKRAKEVLHRLAVESEAHKFAADRMIKKIEGEGA